MPIDNNRKSAATNSPIPSGLIFLIWLLIFLGWSSQSYPRESYSEFIQQVESGQVVKATIDNQEIQYELKSTPVAKPNSPNAKNIFVTRRLAEDPELAKILRAHQVEYSVTAPNPLSGIWSVLSWVILPLLLITLWSRFSGAERQGGMGILGMGNSKARTYTAGDTGVTFDDVAGVDEAKAELQEIVDFLMGKVSTGASDDIQKATDLADRYVTIYGMSKQLGPMAFDRSASQFLGGWGNPRRPLSPEVESEIDREVKHLIDNAHHIAGAILAHNQPLLTDVAQVLLEREILDGQKLHDYLDRVIRSIIMLDIDEMSSKEIYEPLRKVGYGHLGLIHEGKPYVMPMHYYLEKLQPNLSSG